MSTKPEAPEKKWISDGQEVHIDVMDKLIYVNEGINRFLKTKNYYFLSANKGMGKTLLMSYKKGIIHEQYPSALLIPPGQAHLDCMGIVDDFAANMDRFLTNEKKAIIIWLFCIKFSVISYVKPDFKGHDLEVFNSISKSYSDYLKRPDFSVKPTEVFAKLLRMSPNEVQHVLNETSHVLDMLFRTINQDVRIFIDRVDQGLKHVQPDTWIAIQGALLEAAYSIHGSNHHVKIYATIRQEALSGYPTDLKTNVEDCLLEIQYDKPQLQLLLEKLSKFYETKSLNEFLGNDESDKSGFGPAESRLDFLLRHTLYRPRDVVKICSEISEKWNRDQENLVNIVHSVSCKKIIPLIFDESFVFLQSLREDKERVRFMSFLSFNILSLGDIRSVYAKFNGLDESTLGQLGLDDEMAYHPFTELYRIGLLGILTETETSMLQTFRLPRDLQNFRSEKLPISDYYILHPGLRDYILAANNTYRSYKHIRTGHNLEWNSKLNDWLIQYQRKVSHLQNEDLKLRAMELVSNNLAEISKHGKIPASSFKKRLAVDLDSYANQEKDKRRSKKAIDLFIELSE